MTTTTRIFLAALLGAIAMFAWTAIAHMALPLGEAGVQNTMNDESLLSAMKSTVKDQDGLYIYPSMGLGPDATHAQRSEAMKTYSETLEKNPSGFFIYHPAGWRPMTMGKRSSPSGCSHKRGSSPSADELASSLPLESSLPSQRTFRIGTGGVSRPFTPRPICLSSSLVSSLSDSSRRLCFVE
jgi:hypothetical protein